MIFYLLNSKRVIFTPGMAPWFLFLIWAVAAIVNVHGAGDLLGFGIRVMDIVLAGVSMLYVANAGYSLPKTRIVNYLVILWVAIVGLGFLALVIPEVRLKTPLGFVLPESISSNELVRNLVAPPLAEVQRPWGAPEPFFRPAAPFPYANSWGAAFAILVPVVVARIAMTRNRRVSLLLGMLLALSFIPAVATSNRGMFVGLAIAVAYALVRHVGLGHWRIAAAVFSGVTALGVWLVTSGAIGEILGRQEYSDSTGGRMSLYAKTWEQSLQAPILGHGTPTIDDYRGITGLARLPMDADVLLWIRGAHIISLLFYWRNDSDLAAIYGVRCLAARITSRRHVLDPLLRTFSSPASCLDHCLGHAAAAKVCGCKWVTRCWQRFLPAERRVRRALPY
ncbi:O-antigen ligase family protein [Arthrobacter sp. JCM 19049]|uniref:O-antigen ligase family protein n=1 Tax=Arthrobacter sp. JCM 19049 TaxID=1460643 RepID=UPI0024364129|nr:O-antigen ligase family protein [Arthrobacter sp. JCM 19049]